MNMISHEVKYFFLLIITDLKDTVKPKTNPIFAMLDPRTLPIAIPGLPSNVA